ncbi:MAG: hypothetical protein OXH97_08560 [Chloroflexota bacterium]|nr:hypothetical protein [Chloroflexota bacterium]
MTATQADEHVRYEPDERPPWPVAAGVGAQAALVTVPGVVITVVIVARIAEQPASYISWAVFAAMLISGATTVLQAARVGRVGAGHVLIMGTSGAFIAVCVAALVEGGPATMASLIVISSLFQFAMASRLSLLRRVFTPVMAGTVIMLIAATVMPIVFDTLVDVPADASDAAGPVTGLATIGVVLGLVLRGPAAWRLWSPLAGVVVGCAVAGLFGIYDLQPVLDAGWIGVPGGGWPGFDVTPGEEFWALLPAFIVVTLVGAVETVGDGIAIQRVSRRAPRATDFRVVQGALNADGMGNLLSGLAGTLPNTTYSSSISLAEVTGVAARRAGIAIGAITVVLAFLPKFAALLVAIPGPVVAAYVTVLLALLFVQGMRMVVQDGLDHRKAAIAGVAFWVGVGFQNEAIFPDLLGPFAGVLLGNGMTSGALAAVIMILFMELTGPRRRRVQVPLEMEALPAIDTFLRAFASRSGWNVATTERLVSAGEETLAVLQQAGGEDGADAGRRLSVVARMEGMVAQIEFVTLTEGVNIEDQLAFLAELPPIPDEEEISLRLLRHHASSVQHQKYHGIDIVTVEVEGER